MSRIGEAASIAGLVGLAGQSVQAVSALYAFFKAYKSVHPRIEEVAQALNQLCTLLGNIWETASCAEVQRGSDLFKGITDCYEFLDGIKKQFDPIKKHSKDKVLMKLKVAAQKDYFASTYHRLSIHIQHLTTMVCTAAWQDFHVNLEHSTGYLSEQMSAMELSLHQALSQQAASNDLLQYNLNATINSASLIESRTSITVNQFERIDERLAQLQLLVTASMDINQQSLDSPIESRKQRTKQRRNKRIRIHAGTKRHELVGYDKSPKKMLDADNTNQYAVNMVDIAILMRERRGIRTFKLIADPNPEFQYLSSEQKKTIVHYLQSLRLLLWLLRNDNYLVGADYRIKTPLHSTLVREASIHAQAAYSASFDLLDLALYDDLQIFSEIHTRCEWKPWLLYLFNSVDQDDDGDLGIASTEVSTNSGYTQRRQPLLRRYTKFLLSYLERLDKDASAAESSLNGQNNSSNLDDNKPYTDFTRKLRGYFWMMNSRSGRMVSTRAYGIRFVGSAPRDFFDRFVFPSWGLQQRLSKAGFVNM